LLRQSFSNRPRDNDDQRSAGDQKSDRACRGFCASRLCLAIVVSDFPHRREMRIAREKSFILLRSV
jgi:hypothetical protein